MTLLLAQAVNITTPKYITLVTTTTTKKQQQKKNLKKS